MIGKLLNFAYGDEPIPARGATIAEMQQFTDSFNSAQLILRENESPVADGVVEFDQSQDGKYYSEPLHFADTVYAMNLEYTFHVQGSTESVAGTIIEQNNDSFVIVADITEAPRGISVEVSSDNYYPSDVYQYIAESDRGLPVYGP